MTDLTNVLVVAGVAVAVTIALLLLHRATPDAVTGETPLDTPSGAGWLIDAAPEPLGRMLVAADSRRSGGAVIGAAFVVLLATAAVVGWIFSGIDGSSGASSWDASAAEFGRDQATPTSTAILDWLTDLGAAAPLFTVMALIGVYRSVRHSDIGPVAYFAVVGFGVGLLNNGLKLLIDRERPDIAPLAGFSGSSFPSGHTAIAAACWAAIMLVLTRGRSTPTRRIAAAGAIFVAVVVAATRVLLGVHWLSDVAAGLLVGWGWWLVTTIVLGGLLGLGSTQSPAHRDASGAAPAPLRDDPSRPHETSHR